jgi:hypothetical protein
MKDLKLEEAVEVSGGNRPTPEEISPYPDVGPIDPFPGAPPPEPMFP